MRDYKKEITSIYSFAILSGIVQLSLPLGIQTIIGFSFGTQLVVSIYVLIALVVLGVFFVGVLNINLLKLIEILQQKIFAKSSIEIAQTLLKIELQSNQKYYLPEKVNRYFEIFNIQKGISKILLDIPLASIQIIIGLIVLSFYDSSFIVFGFFLIGLLWLILKYTSNLGLQTSILESNDKYQLASWIEDIARTIRTFKFPCDSSLPLSRTDEYIGDYLTNRNQHFKVLLTQYKALIAFKVLITFAMLSIGTYLLIERQLNIGEFIAAEIVILMVMGATEKLIYHLDSLYDVATGLEKLESLFELEVESEGYYDWNPTDKGVSYELTDFSFKFQDSPKYTLDKINLRIAPNTINTIYGVEGEGKTTLLKALASLYKSYEGSILMDGFELSNYNSNSIRTQMGFYFRNQEIFRGSILDNITLGRENIPTEIVVKLTRRLNFQSILNDTPEGFNTLLEPYSSKLSSSKIKKILLLRALIHSPKILFMDEPFIGLHIKKKEILIDYLKEIALTTTIVIVSNDKEILEKSNLRIKLENGLAMINEEN